MRGANLSRRPLRQIIRAKLVLLRRGPPFGRDADDLRDRLGDRSGLADGGLGTAFATGEDGGRVQAQQRELPLQRDRLGGE